MTSEGTASQGQVTVTSGKPPNLSILWFIQSHGSQQQLLEEPAPPGMDAQAGYPGQQEEKSHLDTPNSEPHSSIDLHDFSLQGAQLDNPRKSILIWGPRVTNQRTPMTGALPTPRIAISSWRGAPKPAPAVSATAELPSRRSSCSRENFRHHHTCTEHHWFHSPPSPNQRQRHHPPKISLAPPSGQSSDVGDPHQHLHTATERTSAPSCSCCPA